MGSVTDRQGGVQLPMQHLGPWALTLSLRGVQCDAEKKEEQRLPDS